MLVPAPISQFINACRWIFAFAVMAGHATAMFSHFGDIMTAPHGPFLYAWWFFTGSQMAHLGVVGFFVISGYLIGGGVLAQIRERRDFLREYFIHRVARIYVVLLPALALTVALDGIGRSVFAASGVYEISLLKGHFSPFFIFPEILNLQEIYAPFYGSNGPLWSLACEFWYYVTFPLLLLPWARNYSAKARWGGFLLGAALLVALSTPPSFFKFGYVLWGLGALAAVLPRPALRSRWLSLLLWIAAVTVTRLAVRGPLLAAHPYLQDVADLTVALTFVNLALSVRFGPQNGWRLLQFRFHETLADFSYSLYSIHAPVLIFIIAALNQALGAGWTPHENGTPAHWMALAATMSVTLAASYGFSRLTEARTREARDFLRRHLSRVAGLRAIAARVVPPGSR